MCSQSWAYLPVEGSRKGAIICTWHAFEKVTIGGLHLRLPYLLIFVSFPVKTLALPTSRHKTANQLTTTITRSPAPMLPKS